MGDDAATATGAPRAAEVADSVSRSLASGHLIAERYRLDRLLGRGGMGQVWLARDLKLGREVAIKVLAPEFSNDPHLRARLQREARAISSLVHPNICTLYDVAHHEGMDFLVMEYLEGTTLAKRLEKGALPLNDVLSYGAQIAEALGHAHKKGVVHRDLKPSNVMITKSGAKLLDFGLAKSTPIVASDVEGSAGPTAEKALTGEGRLVGTLSYMAPEQLEGREADARTDIFGLGTVLYFMATGHHPFHGDSDASLIASILKDAPPSLRAVEPLSPIALEHVVEDCLQKDSEKRWQSANDIAAELRWINETATEPVAARFPRRWLIIAILIGAIAGFAAAAVLLGRIHRVNTKTFSGKLTQLTFGSRIDFAPALSPDGSMLAYLRRSEDGPEDIFVQRVGGTNAVNVTSDCPERDFAPTFSPDGKQLAYASLCDTGIYVIGAGGESRRRITTFGDGPPAWSPDGHELAFTSGRHLWRVDLGSLKTRLVAEIEGVRHPTWSPSGRYIAAVKGVYQQSLVAVDRDGRELHEVFHSSSFVGGPLWSGDGSWIYFTGAPNGGTVRTLWRISIDSETALPAGAPQQVSTTYTRGFSMSADGRRIAFSTAVETFSVDRFAIEKKTLTISPPKTLFETRKSLFRMAPSPDEQLIAVESREPDQGIYTVRSDGTNLRRLTSELVAARWPIWTTDGSRLMFIASREGRDDVWIMDREGSNLQQLTNNTGRVVIDAFERTADGTRLFVNSSSKKNLSGIVNVTKASSDRTIEWLPLVGEGRAFRATSWAPDGKSLVGVLSFDAHDRAPNIQIEQGAYIYNGATRQYVKVADGVMGDPEWFDRNHILLSYYPEMKVLDLEKRTIRHAFTLDLNRGGGLDLRVNDGRTAMYLSKNFAEGNIYMLELLEH